MTARTVVAGVAATLGLLLLPAAVMGHWATEKLADTAQFVAALAPLADDPIVQDRIIAEVTVLVDDQIDIDGVTADLLSGLGEAIDLGDRAQAALDLVSAPIAAGVRALVEDVVGDVVRSPAFSAAWARSIELVHAQTIRLLAGSPDSLLTLDRAGTLSLPLGPIVAEVRASLIEQGVPFAAAIPEVDRELVLAELPNLALARVVYQVGTSMGVWLPWVTAALLLGAVLLGARPPSSLRTIGVLTALAAGLLALGFAIARIALVAYVGPESSAITGLFFDALLGYALTTLLGLVTLGVLAALVGWWFGGSPAASRARVSTTGALSSLRAARERSGITLGRTGRFLFRERLVVHLTLVALASLPAILNPPLSPLTVLGSAALALGLVVLAEVMMTEPSEPAVTTQGTVSSIHTLNSSPT